MAKSKSDLIAERQANLPLPEQPPGESDWNSADARTVNVGSGEPFANLSHGAAGATNEDSLRGPTTGASAVRIDGDEWKTHVTGHEDVGRTAKDGLSGLPNDAVTRDKKDHAGLADTTGEDYGYPHKSDPSSGLKK